jgi:hypothetical protein
MSRSESIDQGAEFRLASVLAHRMREEGSYAALARAITTANDEGQSSTRKKKSKGDVIDRRKLKSLVEGGSGAVLTRKDLFALDHYLSQYGESLAARPILRKPDLMQALGESGRVTFLLGSRPEVERVVVSQYDLLGMGEIQRAIGHADSGVRYDVQTVPLPGRSATIEDVKAFEALLSDENGPSLCCLASARSNPFAERLLCAFFGYSPFAQQPLPKKATLPFQLIWNPTLSSLYQSHFRADAASIRARNPKMADEVDRGEASVLVTPEKLYVDRLTHDGWGDTYGVCMAQRRRRGQVWLLLLGITGASTFVSAKVAKRLATRMNECPDGRNSDIYWGIVKARVEKTQRDELFNLRQFTLEEIETQPPLPAPDATD